MKWIFYNIVPVGVIILTAWLAYLDKAWGWGLFVVLLLGWVYPKTTEDENKK